MKANSGKERGNNGEQAAAFWLFLLNKPWSVPCCCAAANLAAWLNFILAVRSGQPLPIIAGGTNLAAVFNPTNTALTGAGAALGSIGSLLALERSIQNQDFFGTVNALPNQFLRLKEAANECRYSCERIAA